MVDESVNPAPELPPLPKFAPRPNIERQAQREHPRFEGSKLLVSTRSPEGHEPACERVLSVPTDALQVVAELEDVYVVMVRAVIPKAAVPETVPGSQLANPPTPPRLPLADMPTVNLFLVPTV